MKLTCVTAVFNAIKSGNRENLIRCVRSVAALKTEHEHLIYDGASTDGTVELLRELEREINGDIEKVGGESRSTAEGLGLDCCAREVTSTAGGVDRRACAERKVSEWLAGVDETTFVAALERFVGAGIAEGAIQLRNGSERELIVGGAREFFGEFSRKIISLSDKRCVYFVPDPRSKERGITNSQAWAEYAVHAVTNGGALIPGKAYHTRWFNHRKVENFDLISNTLKAERCAPVLRGNPIADSIKFFGETHDGGDFDVVVRLDEYGNANANMTEVTFEASKDKKRFPRLKPLSEAVEAVVCHQAAGTNPSTFENSIANPYGVDKGGGVEKVGGESRSTAEGLGLDCCAREVTSTTGGVGRRACAERTPRLRVVSEPDTGIYNALNKGVRDAKGEWFYVLGCDDYICHPEVLDRLLSVYDGAKAIVAPISRASGWPFFRKDSDLSVLLWDVAYSHQGLIMWTDLVRENGGFDENFRICADWDLMRKAHDAGVKYRYTYESFAEYGVGGMSECGDGLAAKEVRAVTQAHLHLDDEEMDDFWRTKNLPWSILLRYVFHCDYGYRISARAMVVRKAKPILRICLYPIVILTRPFRHRHGSSDTCKSR